MTIEYLKRGKPQADRAEDDAKTAAVVAATLKDIEQRGDEAVRELAVKFDKYDRDSYRLSEEEIEEIIAKVSPQDLEDIRFAQAQVTNFAQAQRDS
ncbi:histidinol dehydrogenase, partial [Fluviibacterium sp. DFM31]